MSYAQETLRYIKLLQRDYSPQNPLPPFREVWVNKTAKLYGVKQKTLEQKIEALVEKLTPLAITERLTK